MPDLHDDVLRHRAWLLSFLEVPAGGVARVCCEMLEGYDREVFLAISLSTSNRIIGSHVCRVGTVDASIASPREVFRFAILVNARSIIAAHNLPSGNLEPSNADVIVSKQLKAAGDHLGIPLLDSIVCGFGGRYTSLVERGLL